MPELPPDLPEADFRRKAQTVVDTVIACAKDALENEPFHPTKQALKAKASQKKKPWWKQKQEV